MPKEEEVDTKDKVMALINGGAVCAYCRRPIKDGEDRASVFYIPADPGGNIGRFVNGELRLLHKDSLVHGGCW